MPEGMAERPSHPERYVPGADKVWWSKASDTQVLREYLVALALADEYTYQVEHFQSIHHYTSLMSGAPFVARRHARASDGEGFIFMDDGDDEGAVPLALEPARRQRRPQMRQPGVVDSPIAEVGGNPVHREEADECVQSPAGLVGEDASGSEQRGSNSGDAKSSSTSTSGSISGSSGQSTHSSRTSVARSELPIYPGPPIEATMARSGGAGSCSCHGMSPRNRVRQLLGSAGRSRAATRHTGAHPSAPRRGLSC